MKTIAIFALCTALATPAFAETVGEKTGVNSTMGIAPITADFVREAAISDLFEIQESKLAVERATGPTKQFAEKMIRDHMKTTSELKPMAMSAKIDVPTALDSSHQKMVDKLAGLNGADFAKEYHSDQDSNHKDAVSLFMRYSTGGENQEMKAWAGKTLPVIQDHMNMAKGLDS